MGRKDNERLAFHENNIAGAYGIVRRVKLLANEIDDPNQLRILREIAEMAARIQERNISEMQKEKENE